MSVVEDVHSAFCHEGLVEVHGELYGLAVSFRHQFVDNDEVFVEHHGHVEVDLVVLVGFECGDIDISGGEDFRKILVIDVYPAFGDDGGLVDGEHDTLDGGALHKVGRGYLDTCLHRSCHAHADGTDIGVVGKVFALVISPADDFVFLASGACRSLLHDGAGSVVGAGVELLGKCEAACHPHRCRKGKSFHVKGGVYVEKGEDC